MSCAFETLFNIPVFDCFRWCQRPARSHQRWETRFKSITRYTSQRY